MPKVILISGGSDGLGKAMAKKLAPNNQVVILAHNKTKLEAAAKEINCDFVEAEITDYSSIENAVKEVINKYQKIDVLINNAGVWIEGSLVENDPEKIKEVIGINSTGTIFLTKAVLPHMQSAKSGQIINIISQDGLCCKKDRSVYHASKWAITGFTKCLQDDLEEENIKVTAVYPGLIKTKLFEKNGVQRDLSDALEPEEVALQIETVINLSRNTYIPELSIKNKLIKTPNMDDTSSPVIDLNIDPNMITAQDDTPQIAPKITPVSPVIPIKTPGVIDITPGSTDTFTSYTPSPSHIDAAPIPEPKTTDITPLASTFDSLSHLSDLNPEPVVEQIPESTDESTSENVPESVVASVTPENTAPEAVTSITPVIPEPVLQNVSPQEVSPQNTSPQVVTPQVSPIVSPLAEDPDLVKLIK